MVDAQWGDIIFGGFFMVFYFLQTLTVFWSTVQLIRWSIGPLVSSEGLFE